MRISDWSSDVCSSDLSLSTPGRKGPRPMPRKPSMTCVHPAAIVRMLVGATDCVADAAGPRLFEYTNTTTSAQSANVQIEADVSAIQIHGRAIAAATAGTPRIHRTSLTCSYCAIQQTGSAHV